MSKTDLEQLVLDARAKGLSRDEIEIMKRHYFSGVLEYGQKRTVDSDTVRGRVDHADMSAWHGYVRAAAYVRQTIDAIQKGEKQ